MKFTAKQLEAAQEIYCAWSHDDEQDLEFEDWLADKIKHMKAKSGTNTKSSKKVNSKKKVKWHVSSYSPEMGWFCEYDGYDRMEAEKTYAQCKKTNLHVTIEQT